MPGSRAANPEVRSPFRRQPGRPACFKIALASTGLRILDGTVKVRFVIGLNQIS